MQSLEIVSRTPKTVKLHFKITSNLFVQLFASVRSSGRFSLALIESSSGRLYGRDRDHEHGEWHLHPYEDPTKHLPLPEGVSPQVVFQFLADVETIIIEHELL